MLVVDVLCFRKQQESNESICFFESLPNPFKRDHLAEWHASACRSLL